MGNGDNILVGEGIGDSKQHTADPYSVVRPRLNKFDPDSVCVFNSQFSLIDHIGVASNRPGVFQRAVFIGRNGKINWSSSGHCIKL